VVKRRTLSIPHSALRNPHLERSVVKQGTPSLAVSAFEDLAAGNRKKRSGDVDFSANNQNRDCETAEKGHDYAPIGSVATSNKLQLAFRDFPGFFTHNTTRYTHRDRRLNLC
jgi:hypothetical protein